MEKLTIQEEEVMLYIWSIGDCFVKEIVSKFPDPKPPYTTVASIVNNLKRKGYVAAQRFGNTYQYTPLIKQSEYKRTFMGGVVQNYFANSYKEMVSFFAKEQKISADDLLSTNCFAAATHSLSGVGLLCSAFLRFLSFTHCSTYRHG